jgi:transposase
VQRWARLVRQVGPEILCENRHYSRASKLSSEQRTRLVDDLKRRLENDTEKGGVGWSGTVLMRHILQNYGVRFSARHCRRFLTHLRVAKPHLPPPTLQKQQRSETSADYDTARFSPRPLSDSERKRRALAGIKRLASSGLPLQAFAYTLFDLVHDAVPYDEISPGLTVETKGGASWITRNFDYARWFPSMEKYVLEGTPEINGLNPSSLLQWNPSTVLCHEQMARPDYHQSEGYNEFFRPLGMHHGVLTVLRDHQRRFLGSYPVFRSEKMKPFGRDDVAFFNSAAPHIALGAKTAMLISAAQRIDRDSFEPFQEIPQGVVVMNRAGKILSLNRAARSIFSHFALCDGFSANDFIKRNLYGALNYIAHQIQVIFDVTDDVTAQAEVPLVRLYSHRSGLTLRLRGLVSYLPADGANITVLIEVGEPGRLFLQRLVARYALSERQAELLWLLRQGASGREISAQLQTRRSSLKSSLRELRLKLDLPDLPSLREFARTISAYSMLSALD